MQPSISAGPFPSGGVMGHLHPTSRLTLISSGELLLSPIQQIAARPLALPLSVCKRFEGICHEPFHTYFTQPRLIEYQSQEVVRRRAIRAIRLRGGARENLLHAAWRRLRRTEYNKDLGNKRRFPVTDRVRQAGLRGL